MQKLNSASDEQLLTDCEGLIRKSLFMFKSATLSTTSLANAEYKFMVVRGLFLVVKRLNKRCQRQLTALKDAAYVVYLKVNVVDKVHSDIMRLKNELIKPELDKPQSGFLNRNNHFFGTKTTVCLFFVGINRNL